jgi:hypothetical protein
MSFFDVVINDIWPNNTVYDIKKPTIVGKFFQDYYSMDERGIVFGDEYDFIINRYKTPVTLSRKIFDKDTSFKFYIPHHFNTEIYKNYGMSKIYDILIYGNMYEPLYPFRVRIKNLLLKNSHRYKIKFIQHPGYNNTSAEVEDVRRESLSRIINQSWLSLTVPTNNANGWDDFLQKFGEVSLSYSLILGYPPDEARSHYNDNYCNITPDMTDEEILQVIDSELSNKPLIIEKTERVYNTFLENYDVNHYSSKFYEICKQALEVCKKGI